MNPQEITIRLPIDVLQQMVGLLGTHAFNQVADLIQNIQMQTRGQLEARQQPAMPPQAKANGEDRLAA